MKKKLIDEPVVRQMFETLSCGWTSETLLKLKHGCDQLACGHGEYGKSITNPIPVNGVIGEVFYLNRLKTKDGKSVSYRRVCSRPGVVLETNVDEYEVTAEDGQACVLYFDMYNFIRSTMAPYDFILKPVSDFTDEEIESMKILNPEMYT